MESGPVIHPREGGERTESGPVIHPQEGGMRRNRARLYTRGEEELRRNPGYSQPSEGRLIRRNPGYSGFPRASPDPKTAGARPQDGKSGHSGRSGTRKWPIPRQESQSRARIPAPRRFRWSFCHFWTELSPLCHFYSGFWPDSSLIPPESGLESS